MGDKRDKTPTPDFATSAAHIPKKAATFPPDRWASPYASKTRPPGAMESLESLEALPDASADADERTQPLPPTETEAREFLNLRFRAAGYQLAADYSFHAPGVAVVLDGYDADRKTGYVYVSHHDIDVVSDVGHGEELAFKQMFDTGEAFVFCIHDRDVDQLSTLEHRLDEFLAKVHRRAGGE